MNKIIILLGSLVLAAATPWAQPSVDSISIFVNGELNPLTDIDTVMHGTPLRLEVGASASTGRTVERVEFFRYGNFIGEGVLGANGDWHLITEATVPVFSAIDEPSSTLLDVDVDNGGFEDWSGDMPVGWARGTGSRHPHTGRGDQQVPVTMITGDAHTGSRSVEITGVPDASSPDGRYTFRNWSNVWFYNNIGMGKGNVYRIRFHAKRMNGSEGDGLEVGAGYNNTTIGAGVKYSRTDGAWHAYELRGKWRQPGIGTPSQIVFTSKKGGTRWRIDSVKVELVEDPQDIYHVRAIDSSGQSVASDYFGLKARPFDLKINFQSQSEALSAGYLPDYGAAFSLQTSAYSYGWSFDADAGFVSGLPDDGEGLTQTAASFSSSHSAESPKWELAVPNGEYEVCLSFPQPSGGSLAGDYSLLLEDQFLLLESTTDPAFQKITERIVVRDGRLTVKAQDHGTASNLLAALAIKQLSAEEDSHTYRRGHSDLNYYHSTVIGLDGQQGMRTLPLSTVISEEALPMYYSRNADAYTIPIHGPIVHFGSTQGAAPLLTDVSYDFGVSASNIFSPQTGIFPEEVAAGGIPSAHTMKGFYLVVSSREDGSFIERLPLTLPDPDTQAWSAFLESGLHQRFDHPQYGLTTWIKLQWSLEWNFRSFLLPEDREFNYIFSHLAGGKSREYTFRIEAVSNINDQPAVQYTNGPLAGLSTVNCLYSLSFDEAEPWRTQVFELAHQGELLPSQYLGADTRGQFMSDAALDSIPYRSLNAAGTAPGGLADLSSQAGRQAFSDAFSDLDTAPEFKKHPELDQLVARYGNDPLALTRYVFNEIEVTDYIGIHPGLTSSNVPVEAHLGGLRRDALAVYQEGQGSPREICILLAYLLRACDVPAAIAECSGGNVYVLDEDFSRLIGRNISKTALTPEKIPLKYPWVVAYLEGAEQPIQHLFPWMKETELVEGHDLYDFMPERLNNGFKYFEKFIRADDEVMMIGADGLVGPALRGLDDDQPYVLWPALIKKLLRDEGSGVSFDEIGIRKLNRPQSYARWADFPRPFEILGEAVLYPDYARDPNAYDTLQLFIARDDGDASSIDLVNRKLLETVEIPLMDLHNRSVNIDYQGGKITLSIAPYLPYTGSVAYASYALNTGTALHETGDNVEFLMAHNRDIVAIGKSGTGSNSTEVHILSAASNYQSFSLNTGTALHETGDNVEFLMAHNRDIVAIGKSGTGSNSTEVHILSAASNYQSFSLHTGTALHETGDNVEFLMAHNRDIVAIAKSGTGSNSTEVHILSAASNYQSFSLHTGTALPETGDNVEFLMAHNRDIVAIGKSGTGSNSTEVHILSAASNYQSFSLHTGTALPEAGDNVEFLMAFNRDIVAIQKSSTGSNSTEVHIVSAGDNYRTDSYPSIGAADYATRAKSGYAYTVPCSDASAEFAFREHRQRDYNSSRQSQSTRYITYYGQQNFWNSPYSNGEDTAGIVLLNHNRINQGNSAFCYNYGRVTQAMLERHTQDFFAYEQLLRDGAIQADETVTQHRLFSLMGQIYWQKTRQFSDLVYAKHKFALPFSGGALHTGMEANAQGALIYPFIDVFSLFTSAYWGGHLNPEHGWDHRSAWWDPLHVGHIQGSSYEHAVLRNVLGAEGAYSTVKVLQEASRAHRADPANVPDIVVLTKAPNARNKTWLQEGAVAYQYKALNKALKNWGLWHLVEDMMAGSAADAELSYMPPGPVRINGVGRMAVATVQSSGGAGMYISSPSNPLNGGGGQPIEEATEPGFFENIWNSVREFIDFQKGGDIGYETSSTDPSTVIVSVDGVMIGEIPSSEGEILDRATLHLQAEDAEAFTASYVNGREAGLDPSAAYQYAYVNTFIYTQSAQASANGKINSIESQSASVNTNAAGTKVGDPVDVLNGYFYIDSTDLTLDGPFPLALKRNYISQNTADNQLGAGWKLGFIHYLQLEAQAGVDDALIYAAEMDGSVIAYEKDPAQSNRWFASTSENSALNNHSDAGIGSISNRLENYILKSGNQYTLHAVNGEVRVYGLRSFPLGDWTDRSRPYLSTWHDASGNGFTFAYKEDPLDYGYGNLYQIQATNGNALTFTYNEQHRPVRIATHDGRIVHYQYDAHGDLRKVTLPDRSEIAYTYQITEDADGKDRSTHLLIREEKPLGRILENDYDAQRRVIRQRATVGANDALLENAVYDYQHTQAAGQAVSGATEVTAINGGITRYEYTDGLITRITDAEGQTIEQEWYSDRLTRPDPQAATPSAGRRFTESTAASLADDAPGGYPRSLKRSVDKRGKVTYYWYDAQGNLVQTKRIGEIDGDLTNGDEVAIYRTTYNASNLPTEQIDPLGLQTRIEYGDANYPYLATQTEQLDAAGALISRNENTYGAQVDGAVAAHGLLFEIRQAVGTEGESFTATEYTAQGFVSKITRYTDEDDLANTSSDPNLVTQYAYDARGFLIEEIDPAGTRTHYRNDLMGRPIRKEIFDPAGTRLSGSYQYYNAAGDLEWRDGPRTGVEDYTYMRYDGAGRLSQQLVWRSQARSDGVGVESLPQYVDEAFSVNQYFYDGFGNLTSLVNPNGHEMRMSYDKIGRKLGQDSYEGSYVEGAEPLTSLAWTYESGGHLHTATNTLGGITEYLYTDLGALRWQQNPDGTVSQYRYRLDGRIAKEIYPSGNELRYAYNDLARTVTRTLYKDTAEQLSQTTQYFDRRGNIIREIDAEGYVHQSTFDDLNRVIARTGPAGDGVGTEQQLSTTSYGPILRTVTITDASQQSVVTANDALGRPISIITRDTQSNIVEETYFDYSTDHHSVTRTEGTSEDAIRVTTWTSTQGLPVLVQHHLDTGGYDFERLAYDASGNQILAVDTLGFQTERNYDGLNRMVATMLPDGATTEFRYIDQGEVLQRVMPGGLTHEERFDSAGRLYTEAISNPTRLDADGNIPQERRFTYEYYASGREIGQLQVKRHRDEGFDETYTYDDFLRLKTRYLRGNSDLHSVSLTYAYDKRGLVTEVEQSIGGSAAGIPPTKVERSFDAYGQIRVEQVSEGSARLSSIAQTWNSEGLRSGVRSAAEVSLLPTSTLFGGIYDYDYTYTSAGRLATVEYGGGSMLPSSIGKPYEAAYLTNGLVDYVDAYRVRREHEYDSRGRLTNRSVKNQVSGMTSLLDEQFTWTKRSKMATYSNTRFGRAWGQRKDFTYNPRGQLTGETFLAATNTDTDAAYSYDIDRLGVLTGRHVSGGVSENWDALDLDALARLSEMTEVSASQSGSASYTATGTAGYGEGLRAWHNGQAVELDIEEDPSGETVSWSTELSLSPGSQLLELQLANPHAEGTQDYDVVEKRYFSVKSASVPDVQVEHDSTGRVTRREFSDGSYEDYTWDALGRLWEIQKRDTSGDGYDWSAYYDGLGRRLRVTHTPVAANLPQSAQMNTVSSVYDPQIEFLELGVKVNANATQWKVYGNDLNGRYGGLHGIGGLIAIHGSDPATGAQHIDNALGHQIGGLDFSASSVGWFDRDYSGYGQLGSQPQSIESGGDLGDSIGWRGYRTDATGFIYMGARYYDSVSGRFLSPDPLGHAASMDLYSYAGGDPVNFVDPTGRYLQPFQQVAIDSNIRRAEAFGSSSVDLLSGTGVGIPGTTSMESVENAQKAAGVSALVLGGGITTGVLMTEITVASTMTQTMTTTVAEHVGMRIIAGGVAGGIATKGAFDLAGTAAVSGYAWTQTASGAAALKTATTTGVLGLFTYGFYSDQTGLDTGLGGLSGVDFGAYGSAVNTATTFIDLGSTTSKIGTMMGEGIAWGLDAINQPNTSGMSLAEYMAYSQDPYSSSANWLIHNQQQNVSQDPTGKHVKP